jgi:peptide deformylase
MELKVTMSRSILIWPDPVLNSPTREVSAFDEALAALLDEMHLAMAQAKGIGIAANQLGVALRVAIVGRGDGTTVEMVNPRITAHRGEKTWAEGCLSVPGEEEQVLRFDEVEVTWQDRQGNTHSELAKEKFAHVVQHEVDHLDGTVYVMRVSNLKRDIIRRRMTRLKKDRAHQRKNQ